MKTWKQFAFVAVLTALGILVGFTACDNGNTGGNGEPVLCNCAEKAHLGIGETCPCKGEDCTCTLQIYGSFTDNAGNVINIYRKGEVDNMEEMVGRIIEAAGSENLVAAGGLNGKITKIYITDAFTYENVGGELILSLPNTAETFDLIGLFQAVGAGALEPTVAQVN